MIPSRALAAAALAALLAAPAAADAQARRAREDRPSVRLGGLLGFESGDLDGIALRLDGEVTLQRLSPELVLAAVGSAGFSHLSEERAGGDVTLDLLTAMPALRLVARLAPELGLYGDAGLGLSLARLELDAFPGLPNDDDTDLGLAMRIGVGGYVMVGGGARVSAELAAHPHFGDYDDTTVTVMLGVMFPLR